MCTDLLKIYCVPTTRPHARLLTVFVGESGAWGYTGFRLESHVVYFCQVLEFWSGDLHLCCFTLFDRRCESVWGCVP